MGNVVRCLFIGIFFPVSSFVLAQNQAILQIHSYSFFKSNECVKIDSTLSLNEKSCEIQLSVCQGVKKQRVIDCKDLYFDLFVDYFIQEVLIKEIKVNGVRVDQVYQARPAIVLNGVNYQKKTVYSHSRYLGEGFSFTKEYYQERFSTFEDLRFRN